MPAGSTVLRPVCSRYLGQDGPWLHQICGRAYWQRPARFLPIDRLGFCLCANQYERNFDRLVALIPPSMPRSVLDNDVMRLEMDLFAIIKLCPNLALQNNSIVDRLRPVHARIVGLHGGRQVGNMFGKFLKAGDGIDGRKDRNRERTSRPSAAFRQARAAGRYSSRRSRRRRRWARSAQPASTRPMPPIDPEYS